MEGSSSSVWRSEVSQELKRKVGAGAVPFDSLSECSDMPQTGAQQLGQEEDADGVVVSGGGGGKPTTPLEGATTTEPSAAAANEIQTISSNISSLSLAPSAAESLPPQSERHLPEGVLRIISSYLAHESFPIFSLLAMAGTCRQFRAVTQELHPAICLPFDSLDNVYSSQPLVQRFRKLPVSMKQTVFEAAAGLFSGYTEASFNGDGITDLVLQRAAQRVGPHLSRLRLQNSNVVTETGLCTLLKTAGSLQHAHLEEIPHIRSSSFFVHLLSTCTQLHTLHLSGMPELNWGAVYSAAAASSLVLAPGGVQGTLTKLHVRGVGLEPGFRVVLARMPHLQELEIDGPASNLTAASVSCPQLQRVSYLVLSRHPVHEAVSALSLLPLLKTLELVVKNFTLCAEQLRMIGALPLVELRLDSWVYKQQPTLSRSSYSHVENEGIKTLVDAICTRCSTSTADMQPLKLSLCGATALTHDAVSALLRLPVLTELDIGGCCRIIAMDKMRLVAKVRAGREMLESGRRPSLRSSRFPGLYL